MLGWRRRAKAARESEANQQRLAELVNQTLMENFGPYGSYAITMRSGTDTDDIFHTMLAASVAHDIVTTLSTHGVFRVDSASPIAAPVVTPPRATSQPQRLPLAPITTVDVPEELQKAVNDAAPRSAAQPLSSPVSSTASARASASKTLVGPVRAA
jgi:hypothetical protein